MTEELSEKQKRFGREYMVDFDVPAAYMRAGYSEKSARSAGGRLLRDPRMKAFIEELGVEAAERADLTIDSVLQKLRESYDAATKAKHYAAAIRAAELLGKYLAMFTDVTKNIEPDVPPEEAIKDICTKNGVLNVPAYKAGMEMLRLLRAFVPPRNEDPTQPDPEAVH